MRCKQCDYDLGPCCTVAADAELSVLRRALTTESDDINIAPLEQAKLFPAWFTDGLRQLETSGREDGRAPDGVLTKAEMEDNLRMMAEHREQRADNSDKLVYTALSGKVQTALKVWDRDDSGSISAGELILAAEAQEELRKMGRLLKRFVAFLGLVVAVLIVVICAVTFTAVEVSKEHHVVGGQMVDPAGVEVTTGNADLTVDSSGSLVPRASGRRLAPGSSPVLAAGQGNEKVSLLHIGELPLAALEQVTAVTVPPRAGSTPTRWRTRGGTPGRSTSR